MDDRGSTDRAPRHRRSSSRRGFLFAAGAAVAVGAGGGVTLGLSAGSHDGGSVTDGTTSAPVARVPADLLAAERAEHDLIAATDRALHDAPAASRTTLRLVRADHVAHARALRTEIARIAAPARPPAQPAGRAAAAGSQKSRETRASAMAAARAQRQTGAASVLLACISACEAAHAELLS